MIYKVNSHINKDLKNCTGSGILHTTLAELFMGRLLNTRVPILRTCYTRTELVVSVQFSKKKKNIKQHEKFNYDHRHTVRSLPQLKNVYYR